MLGRESPHLCARANLPLCHHDHFVHGTIGQVLGWLEKKKLIDTHQTGHIVHQIPEIVLLSGCPMVEIYVGHKYLPMLCPFLGVTYPPPPLDLLATIFPVSFFPKT